jgi:hypothetical protein
VHYGNDVSSTYLVEASFEVRLIIVTGTRRSGTSMWMQILAAAGLPVVGEPFPLDWEQTIGTVNPHGFYESTLRDGIYYATNPDPRSGSYLHPVDTRMHVVKVFSEGLVRSDLVFLDRVLVTVRPWREYAASIDRLLAVESQARSIGADERPPRLPGALEWWAANFAVVRDVVMRRYAVHMQSFAGVLANPSEVVSKVLGWIADAAGVPVELDAAAATLAVHPEARTITQADRADVDSATAAVFDAFYAAVHEGRGLDAALLEQMNAVHLQLTPRYKEHEQRVADWILAHASQPIREPLALAP